MWIESAQSIASTIPPNPLSFIQEVGPSLALSVLSCLSVVFVYYGWQRLTPNQGIKNQWLAEHRESLLRLRRLNRSLQTIEFDMAPCARCNRDTLNFWDHGPHYLIFRCERCQTHSKLTANENKEVREVLRNLPGLFVVLSEIKRQPGSEMANHLRELSGRGKGYIERSLLRAKSESRTVASGDFIQELFTPGSLEVKRDPALTRLAMIALEAEHAEIPGLLADARDPEQSPACKVRPNHGSPWITR